MLAIMPVISPRAKKKDFCEFGIFVGKGVLSCTVTIIFSSKRFEPRKKSS